MKHAKGDAGIKGTILLLVAVAVAVNVAMIGYGVFWTWIRSTGFQEQNTAGIKPQEPPGPFKVVSASMPTTGLGLKLSTKNESRKLVNPNDPNAGSLSRGKQAYKLNCGICHGSDGEGHGIMGAAPRLATATKADDEELQGYLNAFLGYRPEIDSSYAIHMTDGEIYWTITKGGEAIMPGYEDALEPETRWDLVNYLKYGLGDQREQ